MGEREGRAHRGEAVGAVLGVLLLLERCEGQVGVQPDPMAERGSRGMVGGGVDGKRVFGMMV